MLKLCLVEKPALDGREAGCLDPPKGLAFASSRWLGTNGWECVFDPVSDRWVGHQVQLYLSELKLDPLGLPTELNLADV